MKDFNGDRSEPAIDLIGAKALMAQEFAKYICDWKEVAFTCESEEEPESGEAPELDVIFQNKSLPNCAGFYCAVGIFTPSHLSLSIDGRGSINDLLPAVVDRSKEFRHFIYVGQSGDLRERWIGHEILPCLKAFAAKGIWVELFYDRFFPSRPDGLAQAKRDREAQEKEMICHVEPLINKYRHWQQQGEVRRRRRSA